MSAYDFYRGIEYELTKFLIGYDMKNNKIIKTENMPSAVLDVYEDGSGRVTFFNNENHWHGEIFLTKEQIDFYYIEV